MVGSTTKQALRSVAAKATSTLMSGVLVVSLAPAVALAAQGYPAQADASLSAAALQVQDDAAKTDYKVPMGASVTGEKQVTVTGFGGGSVGKGANAVKYDALTNPKATVTADGKALAKGADIGSDGTVALDESVIVGSYEAVISSDNYNDVTVKFAYPAVSTATIGGAKYDYLDGASALQYVDATAKTAALAGYEKIGDSDVYYKVADGSTPLSGTLYGISLEDSVLYSELYGTLLESKNLKAADYDTVSSATKFASHHAGDISALVDKDANAGTIDGVFNKAATLASDKVASYVEASILNAAGKDLTEAQTELLKSIKLNDNAMVDPAKAGERVAVDTESANFATGYTYFTQYASNPSKHYGDTKFVIRPKAGSADAGFAWSSYYPNVYAATIEYQDGTKAGLMPWIDLYAENGHGAVEIAINNGKNAFAGNAATTNRFASMYDAQSGRLKAGKYTITVYAAGYNNLVHTFDVSAAVPSADGMSIELQNATVADGTAVTVKAVDESSSYSETSAVQGGKIALSNPLPAGEVQATVDGYDYTFTVSEKVVISKAKNPLTAKAKKSSFKVNKKKAQTTKIIVSKAQGKVTYKSNKKKVTVTSKGKVTVKKGFKGKATITVSAAGNDNYKPGTAKVTITVK